MKKLTPTQCRVLREMMEVSDANGVIDMKVWQYADDLTQKAALIARGAVCGPAGGPFKIQLGHRSMPSVWPETVGAVYVAKLGWCGVVDATPDDTEYFGVILHGTERVAVTRESVAAFWDWMPRPIRRTANERNARATLLRP